MPRTSLFYLWLLALFFCLGRQQSASACDPCVLYNAARLQNYDAAGPFSFSVNEQFSHFDTAAGYQENSLKNGELIKEFSTTSLSFGYNFNKEWGLQTTLPVISRRFTEIENYRTGTDTETGFGDASLLGIYTPLNIRDADWSVVGAVTAGVKFPTGDTGSLERLAEEDVAAEEDLPHLKHHQLTGASSGRALTLGSGSYDYIFGTSFLGRYGRAVFLGDFQYTIRTEGDFDYEFADDIVWSAGPGVYLAVESDFTLATRIALSGEDKGSDTLAGALQKGSAVNNLFVGPEALITIGERTYANIGLDFRIAEQEKDSLILPDYRFRAGIGFSF